ncbi:MAG: BTAD domain-containing putative transcriptional regulator [Streptosporangiaceae bacterium]
MVLWRVLGPLEFSAAEGWAGVNAPKWRALLAALLARPGQVVPTWQLVDELWRDDPPAAARKLVSGYVLRLRRLIGDPGGRVLVTQAPGYRLVVDRTELDAARFEELVAAGRAALRDQDAGQAADLLSEAMMLWRGPALADVPPGPLAAAEAGRLEELRLGAVELRIEAGIRRGRAAELVAELRALTTGHPLRERFWHQLMRVLEACGRRAEALEVYAQARRIIADELGADPGPDLQQLNRRLLGKDSAHSAQPSAAPGAGVTAALSPVPRQLPAAVRHFTGRAAELRRLSTLLSEPTGAGSPMVISAVGGTAGVGKTALAVNWAHQVAERFPDGQLYVNLRGYDPGQPMTAADALAGFLRALGVPGQDVPAEEGERAARYRNLLAGRRMPVVADNAGDVAQVRPLLPGTPSCVMVVTSRDSLVGLVARDGAVRLDLDVLAPQDALSLLRALIGGRVAADPVAAEALAGHCSRLPLALRVAAEFAAARPAASLSDLAGGLADQQRRLDVLDAGGDPRTEVRAVFSWSYRHLDAGAARAFRLAGLHPGPDFDPYAVAALTDGTAERACQLLEVLARAHLVQPATGPGRYGMHDLLRAYARELVAARDSDAGQRAALTRLFDYYLHTAGAAMDTLIPAERHRRPRVPAAATPVPPVGSAAGARAWLDTHRATLVAVAGQAAAEGWPSHATRLATILFRHLKVSGHYPAGRAIHTYALHAARGSGDRGAQADAWRSLGVLDAWQGRYEEAAGQLRQALAAFRQTGDLAGEARTLGYLGIVDWWQGDYQHAAGQIQQALVIFAATGDRFGQVGALNNLGIVLEKQGCYQQAAGHHRQALAISREIDHPDDEAHALDNLGVVERMQCHYEQAAGHHQQALALFREIGHRSAEAHALDNLGVVERLRGRYQQAADHHQQALALFRALGDRSGEAQALNGIGETLHASGRPECAHAEHTMAFGLASQIGNKHEQARAHNGLACAHGATGDPARARDHWQHALTLYTDLGAPEAAQVRTHLATAGK